MMVTGLVVGPIMANCYIIGDKASGEGAIIDPGDDPEKILRKLNGTDLMVKYILATHGHFDHTGGMKGLKAELDVDFLMHEDDLFFVRDSKESARKWGISVEQVPDPDGYLKDGDVLKLGPTELTIIHTPGHSPGGVCIHVPGEKILFSGDTLFEGSIGRTDFREGSLEILSKSIRERLYTLPDDTKVYTGHGAKTTIGNEREHNPFVRP